MRNFKMDLVKLKAYPADYPNCFRQDNWSPCTGRVSRFINVIHPRYLPQRRCVRHPMLSEFGWEVE